MHVNGVLCYNDLKTLEHLVGFISLSVFMDSRSCGECGQKAEGRTGHYYHVIIFGIFPTDKAQRQEGIIADKKYI